MSDTYHVVVVREDGAWLADVPELEGTHTWAKSLPALDKAVREAIVLGADLPDDATTDVRLSVEYRTGDEAMDARTAELRRRRRELVDLEREVAARTEETATRLADRGYSLRDIATLLNVSFQRVSQILGPAHSRGRIAQRNA